MNRLVLENAETGKDVEDENENEEKEKRSSGSGRVVVVSRCAPSRLRRGNGRAGRAGLCTMNERRRRSLAL